jgi:small subunit ribosomal protein S9
MSQTTGKRRKYTEAVGRRKSATARVRIYAKGTGKTTVNDLPIEEYFPGEVNAVFYRYPLVSTATQGKFDISVKVKGGGKSSQLDALVLGLARALVKADEKYRPQLRKHGLLTRDARVVERKKPGRVKARKKRQSPKR